MSLAITYFAATGQLEQVLRAKYGVVADAATAAIRDAAAIVKRDGRGNIAAAGFSKRWQNALRVNVYPKSRSSANAAVFIYHKIIYAGVFERGARISGKPLMWLPLQRLGKGHMSPKKYARTIGPLTSINAPGAPPLLVSRVRTKRAKFKVTRSLLKRGTSGAGTVRSVPVFVGVKSVNIKKKFRIEAVCRAAAAQLPGMYVSHFVDK